jgi:hypothetical protein
MVIGCNEHAIDQELEKLLLVGTYCSRPGCGNNRGLQILGWLYLLRSTSDEELVVDILRTESVEGEARITSEISALG